MSPARRAEAGARRARRSGPRFRRLVDAWQGDRQQRTPLEHGTRVASIEAQLGGDMTPGREGRWERLEPLLGPDEHDIALEDQLFRADLDQVVPAGTPDRDARIEAALDLARERYLAHGEQTWAQEALDLLDQHQAEHQAEVTEPEQDKVEHQVEHQVEPAVSDEEPEP